MRSLSTLAALVVLGGCGPGIDPLLGSYTFTLTSTDTESAPTTNTLTTTSAGTVSLTTNAALTGYVIALGHSDASVCVLEGTVAEKSTSPEITLKLEQKCTLASGSGIATATLTSGKASLKVNDTRAADVMTIDVAYSYAGTRPIFNMAFAGTGKRTYVGTRR